MLDDQLPQRRRCAQDQSRDGPLLSHVKRHRSAEAGGGDENRFAGRLFGDGVVRGDSGGGEAIQSGAAAGAAETGMIQRPHLDWLVAPAAGESTGVPLGALSVAAEAEDVGFWIFVDGGRRAGGE